MQVEDDKNSDFQLDSGQKKRLGQYFTGIHLAKLLASLANAQNALSIIDPMSGNGDMIEACLNIGTKAQTVVGVEIDPVAHSSALRRFPDLSTKHVQFILGDAFRLESVKKMPLGMYDLVITNPPYVRYQSQTNTHNGELNLPDAKTIRESLSAMVDSLPALDATDRQLFQELIKNYSGLSDLAVPAWLLCAMLTRVGGTLAMVVPDAWLSRDYALAIQYLLLRWFKIVYVVEDDHASWFRNALVKTTLVVAKRTKRRTSAFSWKDEGVLEAHLSADAISETSIVGGLFTKEPNPEEKFAKLLLKHSAKREEMKSPLVSLEWVPLRQKAQNLKRGIIRNKWLVNLEDAVPSFDFANSGSENGNQVFLHPTLSAWLGKNSQSQFTSPALLGVNISQGLRTGANQFFYVDVEQVKPQCSIAIPAPIFGIEKIVAPIDCLLPVLRRQSELPDNFELNIATLRGRVLALQKYVLPEDSTRPGQTGTNGRHLEIMPDELATFVRNIAKTNMGTPENPKYIPELSAVRTNVRKVNPSNPQSTSSFWYILTEYAPHHRPDLFVARINSTYPKTYLNTHEHILIDANFSTFWLDKQALISPHALLALLNSTWCVTAMELAGTVMGGGALKLEATHLRRLPFPKLNTAQWAKLDKLGKELSGMVLPGKVLKEIDHVIIGAIQRRGSSPLSLVDLESIQHRQL